MPLGGAVNGPRPLPQGARAIGPDLIPKPMARLKSLAGFIVGSRRDDSVCPPDQLDELHLSEISAQIDAVKRERPIRLIVIALICVIFSLYRPPVVVITAYLLELCCAVVEASLVRAVLQRSNPMLFRKSILFAVYIGEMCFSLPSAILWHVEEPFTKAISVGIMAAAMMRLATIRSIYPVTGFAGIAALASLISVSNSSYWLLRGNLPGFFFTSVIAIVSLVYVISAIMQNHREQQQAAIRKMALQSVSAAKSHFLAQMSHELRTPLNAIIGMGTAAHLATPDPVLRAQLQVLVTSAEGLAVVLNDVLDISAIEEGRITLRPHAGDIRQEIAVTVALFRPQADAAHLDLLTEFADDLPTTLTLDFDRLRQCLANLLSNAFKHTRTGHVAVRLAFLAPALLTIEVSDTGPGVAAGQEDMIFQKYQRVPELPRGYGLGLSICRTLVERMGGDITFLTGQKGATFQIRLPVGVPADAATLPAAAALPDVAGYRVLVVDDISTNRLVAATYLSILNCQAVEAESGPDALRILQTSSDIDLILLDINMPDMDGLATLRQIRSMPGGQASLPVIAMTADASDQDRRAYLHAGMEGYVTKPIQLDILRAEVSRVVARTSPKPAAVAITD